MSNRSNYCSRACVLQTINDFCPAITDRVKQYLVEICDAEKVHLLSAVALLSSRVPRVVQVRAVDRAVHLLKTVQYVEYEDLNQRDKEELFAFEEVMFKFEAVKQPRHSIWTPLFDCNQPTSGEYIRLWTYLVDACGHLLISDLLKLIHEYSTVVEQLNVGMCIDVFDSAFKWEIATILDIVCIGREHFIRIHYVEWNWSYNEWISVHSVRIRLLRNKNGQVVRNLEGLIVQCPLVESKSYDFHNTKTGTWESCTVNTWTMVLTTSTGAKITDWNSKRNLVTGGTFT